MHIKKLIVVVVAVALVSMGLLAGRTMVKLGNPDSPSAPSNTYSYTLEDIYNRLKDGTKGDTTTFTEPAAGPGTGTMHTLNEIMGVAPEQDNTDGATQTQVLTSKTFWGLTSGQWGTQTGTMPNNGAKTYTPDTSNVMIAAGYHNGSGYVEGDADLVAGNIKDSIEIFGVTGEYKGPARFTDNGDSTVTDLQTNLMWTKNANHGEMNWQDAKDYCSALNFAGRSDWRLPTIWEIFSLVDKRQSNPALPDGHPFTGVQSSLYWSSTTDADGLYCAWIVFLWNGDLDSDYKDWSRHVWPVRGGQ